MPNNPVVIAGSLSKEELEKSINEIVNTVDVGMSNVTKALDTKLTEMQGRLQSFSTTLATNISTMTKNIGGSFEMLAASMDKISAAGAKNSRAASAAGATGATGKNDTFDEGTVGALKAQIKELNKKLDLEKLNTQELQKQVDLLQRAKSELKTQTTSRSFSSIWGMPENSATQIAEKMKALRNVQVQNADEAKKLQNEYLRLSQRQKELLGRTNSLTSGNNALARSFNYIRNRLVYALTIGSVMNFVKQMYSVRAEYELLERSIGVLIDNFRRGSEIFNELNQMALKSPFTLVELGTAAKQLLAYNFAEDEVVDTTRRLADISAALGVPMERLVYNLGQIRAQTVLTARDARDFANAGLAIVPMLAKMYTEQKKFGDEIVTTAQVYDMMKKKLVTYEDVMKVINQVTDEGGKFFDFQAKQAETLKVQLANLTLAWNNMLNDIATGNQSALNTPIRLIKQMFLNWREVAAAIKSVIAVLGVYKTMQFLQSDTLIRWLRLARIGWYQYTKDIQAASGAMATFNAVTKSNVLLALAGVLASVASYFIFFKDKVDDASGEIERFGASGAKVIRDVKNLYAILEVTNKNSSNYAKVMGELNQILEQYGLQTVKETDDLKELNKSRERNIELLKQEALEREHLNNISAVNEKYQTGYDAERKRIEEYLSKKPIFGNGQFSDNARKYSFAISNIISSTVEENLNDVLNKSGDEYFKGVQSILLKVKSALLASNDILGLSEQDIRLLTMEAYGASRESIDNLKQLKEAQEGNAQSLTKVYNKNKDLIDQSATFNDRVDQSRRKLESASNDTEKFYGKLNKIIKDFSGKNIIEFLVDVNAQVPDWMKKMGVEQVTKLASQFGALTENAVKEGKEFVTLRSGEKVTTKYLAMRTAQYTQARKDLEKVVEEPKKTSGSKKDELGDALTKELQLIQDIQKLYKEYTKAGIGMDEAKIAAAKEYENTLRHTNATLSKFGIQGLSGEALATMDLREMRDYYQSIIDKVQSSPKAVEALEKAIRNLNVEITKEGQKTIIDSLNSELSKLKDEYELGVELDANPELGSAFAETFGLDVSGLPRTIEQVIRRAQDAVDKALGSGGLFNVLTGNIEDLRKSMGQSIDSGIISEVEKAQKAVRDLWKKDAQETINDWNKLLEKYAEYEYKRNKIMEDAEKEREVARKRNASDDIMNAIDLKERRQLAQLNFELFQQSPEWIAATGDLATFTDSAINSLIRSLEEYKKKAKNLDPKQIKQINNALKSLYREQRKGNPFLAIANALDEAKSAAAPFVEEVDRLKERQDELIRKRASAEGGVFISEKELKELDELPDKIQEAEDKAKKFGKVSATAIVEGIQGMQGAINQVTGGISEMFSAFGNTEVSENIQKVTQVLDKAASFAAMGAQVGGGWGAVIGGVVGGLMGAVTAWADEISGNASITRQIERSEKRVRSLENGYKVLQKAMDDAYGTAEIGAKQVAIENKKLQLAELERQLQLEQSRSSKNQDEEKISSLKGQIIDLKNEITEMGDEMINSFLGISSIGDAVENFVDIIVNALREGENAMDGFNESIDDMIANMLKKFISTRLIGPLFENAWNEVEDYIKERALSATLESIGIGYGRSNATIAQAIANLEKILAETTEEEWAAGQGAGRRSGSRNAAISTFEEWQARLRAQIEELRKSQEEIGTPTFNDVELLSEKLRALAPILEPIIGDIDLMVERLGLKKSSGEMALSNLQQGIQGITEDTASALEAYMNSVSQQVYLHSTQLEEIKALMQGWNFDVSLGTMSQVLLQLQNSYQVQMTIQNTLLGWSSPNGMSVRVEMV